MHRAPAYRDVMGEVVAELGAALARARGAGRRRASSSLLDPGIGFSKDAAHSLEALRRLPRAGGARPAGPGGAVAQELHRPVLDLPVERRLMGTAAAVAACVLLGAPTSCASTTCARWSRSCGCATRSAASAAGRAA